MGYFQLVWDRKGGLAQHIVGGPLDPHRDRRGELGEVVQDHAGVTVRYEEDGNEHTVRARYAVLAKTANVARSIAPNLNQDLRDALGQIKYGPYVSTVFLTNETRPQIWDNPYTIATPKRAFNVFIKHVHCHAS